MDYVALKAELTGDPLSRGYLLMSAEEAADELNAIWADPDTRTASPETVTAAQIWNALDETEYEGLNQSGQSVVDYIGQLPGDIPIQGGLIKTKLFGLFGAGSTSRDNLLALARPPISRAVELFGQEVTPGDVEFARSL